MNDEEFQIMIGKSEPIGSVPSLDDYTRALDGAKGSSITESLPIEAPDRRSQLVAPSAIVQVGTVGSAVGHYEQAQVESRPIDPKLAALIEAFESANSQCLSRGGIPIVGAGKTPRVADCKFPPAVNGRYMGTGYGYYTGTGFTR